MTMPTAADFRAAFDPFDAMARDVTWYPGPNLLSPRSIRALIRELTPQEQISTVDEVRWLVTVRHDEVEGQSGGVVPEPYNRIRWDGMTRLIREVQSAEINGAVVKWTLRVSA